MVNDRPSAPAAGPLRLAAGFAGRLLGGFGGAFVFLGQALAWAVRPPLRMRLLVEQMEFIGYGSLGIILLVAAFTGAVFGLQTVEAFRLLRAESYVGPTVGLVLTLELSPVLTSLMVTGRAGSAMATELGSMRITEQIDALATMAVNPIQYLVVPRLAATVLMMPVLTMVYNVVGMAGTYLVAVIMKGVDRGTFLEYTRWFVDPKHIGHGLVKSVIFGLALSLIGCYQGYFASGGAKGVGIATTRAVVYGSVTVLVLDYFVTDVLLYVWPL